jgi:hypothetical protein
MVEGTFWMLNPFTTDTALSFPEPEFDGVAIEIVHQYLRDAAIENDARFAKMPKMQDPVREGLEARKKLPPAIAIEWSLSIFILHCRHQINLFAAFCKAQNDAAS